MKDDNWLLCYDRYIPEEQRTRESLCALGNGYLCTRGAFCESRDSSWHYPGTYLAGGYNRLVTEISGKFVENEDLVNMPNWLYLSFRTADGDWFDIDEVEIRSFRQCLDMKCGTLSSELHFSDQNGRESLIRHHRFVHMGKPHIAAFRWSLKALNWNGSLEIRSGIDGKVENTGVERYRSLQHHHLQYLSSGASSEDALYLKMQTCQSGLQIAMAVRNTLRHEDSSLCRGDLHDSGDGLIFHHFDLCLVQGESVTLDKTLACYHSRDTGISECELAARDTLAHADDFRCLLTEHEMAWKLYREHFSLDCETEEMAGGFRVPQVLRLHLFHLLQTLSENSCDLDVGAPARGWHGEAYRGHIFWDEIYIFPVLNMGMPWITKALLMYRYRRLEEARRNAREEGFCGAMYPWQSGSSGREESQRFHLNPHSGRWIPDRSLIQRHVNIAIAYNLLRYYEWSGDDDFFFLYGCEMLLSIARFLVSLCDYDQKERRYVIRGVMGPDEFHDGYPYREEAGIDNNAYTNAMVAWILFRIPDVIGQVPEIFLQKSLDRSGVGTGDLQRWQDIACHLRIPFLEDGVISQFDAYHQLAAFNWEEYRKKYGDIHRLDRILESEGDSANQYQVNKQADTLMLFFLLDEGEVRELFSRMGYALSSDMIRKTIAYYRDRSCHGSTLSRVVHSWVLHAYGMPGSWDDFRSALLSDVMDSQNGTTGEGIHLGAMCACVDIVQRGFAGIGTDCGQLSFRPRLPSQLSSLCFHITFRKWNIRVSLSRKDGLLLKSVGFREDVPVRVWDDIYTLKVDQELRIPLSDGGIEQKKPKK